MKKSTLALSIAAAIGSLGLAGAANASMAVNAGGTGHQLVFPYFSAQGDNATLLSITNTDTTNGKLVKVRFRGAANSDDLFDFTLALSPGDVWTAAVTKDAATGLAQLATTDKSCTLPASVNAKFSTFRLDPSASDADKAAGTREGYVEVITMGDIAKLTTTEATTVATALFTTIKHKAGVAPCAAAVMTEKLSTKAKGDAALAVPTGGISGDWIILNQTSTAAWSGSATALSPNAVGATVNKVFWPQISGTPDEALAAVTSDPLLVKEVVAIQNFDLPDMSTPYSSAAADAKAQADQTTAALAKTNIMNQYVTDDAIAAVTDLLFSQPTRRYHVAVNYTALADDVTTTPDEKNNLAKTGTKAVAIFRDTTSAKQESKAADASASLTGTFGSAFYRPTNMGFQTATSRTLCLNSISTPNKDNRFDREETTPATESTDFTISPVVVTAASKVFICGEAAVISINDGGVTAPSSALGATVARNDITFKEAAYTDGWMSFSTLGADGTSGLPILGQAFIRAANGAVNYGFGYAHKTK